MAGEDLDFDAFMERFEGLRKALPDNTVHYSIHSFLSEQQARPLLNTILQTAKDFKKQLLKSYIWEKDPFELSLQRENCKP